MQAFNDFLVTHLVDRDGAKFVKFIFAFLIANINTNQQKYRNLIFLLIWNFQFSLFERKAWQLSVNLEFHWSQSIIDIKWSIGINRMFSF